MSIGYPSQNSQTGTSGLSMKDLPTSELQSPSYSQNRSNDAGQLNVKQYILRVLDSVHLALMQQFKLAVGCV